MNFHSFGLFGGVDRIAFAIFSVVVAYYHINNRLQVLFRDLSGHNAPLFAQLRHGIEQE